jgi:hypothetical protein
MIYSTSDASLCVSLERFRFATTINSCWIFYSIFFCFFPSTLPFPGVSYSIHQKNGGVVANSYSGVNYILGMRRIQSTYLGDILYLTITHRK